MKRLASRDWRCYTQFATMTELIGDGKYKDGKKQGPVRIAQPFQTIETVNESAQDRRRNPELFARGRDIYAKYIVQARQAAFNV